MAWIVRMLLAMLARRMVRARRTGQPVVNTSGLRQRVDAAREAVGIAGLLVVVAVLGTFSAGLLAAGVTGVVLGPRWLGGVGVGLAVVFALATVPELMRLRRTVRSRRRRRHERDLQQELDGTRS
jgi:protein-S-isoprenylcysteine O-methyltransferase Ste14